MSFVKVHIVRPTLYFWAYRSFHIYYPISVEFGIRNVMKALFGFGECRANGRQEGCTVVMGLLLTNIFISLYTNTCLGFRKNLLIILNSNLPHYALWLVINFSASLRMDKNVSVTTFFSEAAFQVQINVTLLSSLRLIQPCESMAEFPRLVMHKHCSLIFVTMVTKRVFYYTKVDRDLNS